MVGPDIDAEKRECLDRLKALAADDDVPTDVQQRLYQVVDFIDESEQFGKAADYLADTRTILIDKYEYHDGDELPVKIAEVETDLVDLFNQFGEV